MVLQYLTSHTLTRKCSWVCTSNPAIGKFSEDLPWRHVEKSQPAPGPGTSGHRRIAANLPNRAMPRRWQAIAWWEARASHQ